VLLDGTLKDGILDGRLILQGGGDPALTPERFWLLLREIRARGVREIRGEVVLDGSFYRLARSTPPPSTRLRCAPTTRHPQPFWPTSILCL